ncbi:hypothetical protein HDE_01979 [Halotydeus destructor]|nr:hypothetical protein HDE_01979 [Halotydeus destructor]
MTHVPKVTFALRANVQVAKRSTRPYVSAVPLPMEEYVSSNPFGLAVKSHAVYQTQLGPICGQVWRDYREQGFKRYQDAPAQGVSLMAEYYDNAVHVGTSTDKTVLMLHGAPGNYQHFSSLISHLTKRGVRVIAPNFPGFDLTVKSKWFRHSPKEKLEYAKGILSAVGVHQVDAVVTHSSAIYTAVEAWQDTHGPVVKSFVLLNPCGLEKVVPMTPEWLITWLLKTYESEVAHQALDKVGQLVLASVGNAFATSSFSDAMLGAAVNHYAPRHQLGDILPALRDKQVPVTMVYSEADRVMTSAMTKKLMGLLGASEHNADTYDKKNELTKKGNFVT